MSVSAAIVPSASAVAPRRDGGTRTLWMAGLYYLVAALVLTMWLWADPASRMVAANPYDGDQFAWFFRYDATAVAHLRLPALTTAAMNAPLGINLMWNTPMFLPGVLLAPLTLLAGPQASLTVLMTLGFAGSALALFAVLRRRGVSVAAAAAGGLVYGFSPALAQSAQGHYDLQFAVLPPLIADAIGRLACGHYGAGPRAEGGRREAARLGAWLGLLMAAQLFIDEESLFDAALAALILLAVLAASGQRPAPGRTRDALAGAGAAVAVLATAAGYPLWEQFFGPVRQHGSPFQADYYKNDLAGFVRPSSSMLLHSRGSAAFAGAFQGQSPEYLAYLGWPMLIALAVAAAWFWRRPAVRATAVTFAVLEVASLGGTLLAGGHEYSQLKLPWYWVQALPVIGSAIPDRFSIVADGAAAALFAFGLDAALARWPRAPRPEAERRTARWPGAPRPVARWAVVAAAVAALAPLVPRPLPTGNAPAVPAGWTAAFAALRLPATAHILVVPVPQSSFTEPLRWQADTGVPSSMFAGYFMGPRRDGHAETDGPGALPGTRDLNRLWTRSSGAAPADGAAHARTAALPPADAARRMRALIERWRPAAVVAVTGPRSPLGRYLTGILGRPAASAGTVMAWRLRG